MSIKLIIRELLGMPLWIGEGVEVKIVETFVGMSPGMLLEENYKPGWHPANKYELQFFASKYHPGVCFPEIFGMDQEVQEAFIGPFVMFYKTQGGLITEVREMERNPTWRLPKNSKVLFVKKNDD